MGLALIDQDGVVADFERGLLDAFRAEYPGAPFIDLGDRRAFYAHRQYAERFGPEWGEAVRALARRDGFFLGLPAIAGAVDALKEMDEAGHAVFLCTSPLSGSRSCVPDKLAWVEDRLGQEWVDRVIISKDKTLVGDRLQRCVLVDDRPEITGCATRPPWQHVLFAAPYNEKTQDRPRLRAWASWREVLAPYL